MVTAGNCKPGCLERVRVRRLPCARSAPRRPPLRCARLHVRSPTSSGDRSSRSQFLIAVWPLPRRTPASRAVRRRPIDSSRSQGLKADSSLCFAEACFPKKYRASPLLPTRIVLGLERRARSALCAKSLHSPLWALRTAPAVRAETCARVSGSSINTGSLVQPSRCSSCLARNLSRQAPAQRLI